MSLYNINKQTQIDEFGVDHSNFSLREELEYNKMRADERNAAERQSFHQPQQYWQQTPIAYQGGQTSLPVNAQSYLSSESQTKSELTDDQKIARQFVSSLPDMGAYNPPKAQGYYIKDDKNYAWTLPHNQNNLLAINSVATPNVRTVWSGVPTAAFNGFIDGTIGGTERLANGLTGGVYGSLKDHYMYNSYTDRQNRLRNQAYNSGLGYLYDTANTLIDTDANIAKYYYMTKFGNKYVK